MTESPLGFHHLEWPGANTRVAGPVVWVRGWVHGKAPLVFIDIRAVAVTGVHLGVLGLPRPDLAAHFKTDRAWLPAEYVIGVPLPVGPGRMTIEASDEFGRWHVLETINVDVANDGAAPGRVEGEIVAHPGGTATRRGPHLPWHGHLDHPTAEPAVRDGQLKIFGWLLHETAAVERIFATLDGLTFSVIESGVTDDTLATKVPQHTAARQARLRGTVAAPVTLASPACLRVYAELTDGSIHLCFAQRVALPPPPLVGADASADAAARATMPEPADRQLPALPSARPRRLLMVVRSLAPDDTTWRALDVAQHLLASGRWAVRVLASEDGPLHAEFERADCPVQLVDPLAYFTAVTPAASADALRAIGRQIWWRHLDALALFDAESTWAERLASEQRVPVFKDPVTTLLWSAPDPLFVFDPSAPLIAPLRGVAGHGAGVLLQAWELLQRRHAAALDSRTLLLGAVRASAEESRFSASVALNFPAELMRAPVVIRPLTWSAPQPAVALICPAFSAAPQRALLSALACGVPVVTTPDVSLISFFAAIELSVVQPNNPLALAHAIADTLANPLARDRRVAAARRVAQTHFAPALQLPRWQAQLESSLVR